jgi:hypothetical protein
MQILSKEVKELRNFSKIKQALSNKNQDQTAANIVNKDGK